MHFIDIVIREISAEGLAGISLPVLWDILSREDYQFPWKLTDRSKQFLWEKIISLNCVSFYANPRGQKPNHPALFDRREWLVETELEYVYRVPVSIL